MFWLRNIVVLSTELVKFGEYYRRFQNFKGEKVKESSHVDQFMSYFIANTEVSLGLFFQIQFLICVTVVSLLSLSLSPCLLCSDKCLPVEAIRHQLVTDQTDTISKGEIINLGSSQKHLYKYIWSRPPTQLNLNYYRDYVYKVPYIQSSN